MTTLELLAFFSDDFSMAKSAERLFSTLNRFTDAIIALLLQLSKKKKLFLNDIKYYE